MRTALSPARVLGIWTLASAACFGLTTSGALLYHVPFEDPADQPALTNQGAVAGKVAVDTERDNWRIPPPGFVSDTPAGRGRALHLKPGHPSRSGPALVMPDSENRVTLSRSGDAMTIALWVRLHDVPEARSRTLAAKGPWGARGWYFGIDKQRRLVFRYKPSHRPEAMFQRTGERALPLDQWIHVTLVVRTKAPQPKGIELFVDGEPVPLDQGIRGFPVAASEGPLVVGALNSANGGGLNGMIDDVRIYDDAMTLPRIAEAVAGLALKPLRVEDYLEKISDGRVTLDLQGLLNAAAARRESLVKLPAGRFHLASGGVWLAGVNDFTLEGAGPDKTVLVNGMWDGVTVGVSNSHNVTLRHLGVDRDPVPFVQGTLTRVSPDGEIDFETHAGYPQLTDRVMKHLHGTTQFFDRETRRLVERHHWFQPRPGRNVIRLDATRGRMKLSKVWAERVEEGDFVVFRNGRRGSAVHLVNSESVRMEDVTVFASPSVAVAARFLTGHNVFRYDIKRGPPPEGATEPRLSSTNADGMQYFWCPGAVTFEDCDFGFTGDDCINISIPQVFQVVDVQSPTRVLTTVRMSAGHWRIMESLSEPGDVIRHLRYGTFEPLEDLDLQAFDYQGHREAKRWEAGTQGTSGNTRHSMAHVLVEFARPPAREMRPGDRLVPRKFLPERFVIRNNHFHDTRARGLLIMASNGVIENNVIERAALNGIQLCHELPGFGGAGWISDVVVRGNTVRETCFDDDITRYFGSHKLAAVQLSNTPLFKREKVGSFPWATGHRNVRIVGNSIDGSDVAGILVNGLQGGAVKDNVVRNTNRRGAREAGNRMGLSVPYAITLMNSRDVEVSGNEVSDCNQAEKPIGDLGRYPQPRSTRE